MSAYLFFSGLHHSVVLASSPTIGHSRHSRYHTWVYVSGVAYLCVTWLIPVSIAIGFAISATTAANAQDRIYQYMKKRNGDVNGGQPEYRVRIAIFRDQLRAELTRILSLSSLKSGCVSCPSGCSSSSVVHILWDELPEV